MAAFTFKDQAFLASAKSSAFVPPSFANLYLWVRPESLEGHNDGDPLILWPDDSGSGNDLSQASIPTVQKNELNGHAGVLFDGIDDSAVTTTPTVPATTVYTAFIVARLNSAAGTGTHLHVGAVNGYVLLKDTGNREIVHRGVAALTDAACTTNAELWTARKTAVPLTELRVNGVGQGISNSGAGTVAPDNQITLAAFVGAGLFFGGYIFEVMLYDTNLSDADRNIVEAYLMSKYAL